MIMIKAKLTNPKIPDAMPVIVSFPIKEYEEVYRALADAGIGDPVKRDCRVAEISGPYHVLSALRGQDVNVDELDYLAKRLESFFGSETWQFQGTAAARGIRSIEDFINLTFCCQQATVIPDFSDLRAIGREHYLNKNGGCAPVSELDALDAEQEARDLIQNGSGTVTPYGMVYENGMEIERLYKGKEFPAYLYDQSVLSAELAKKSEPDGDSTWLFLPMPEVCVKRALARGGFDNPDDMSIDYEGIRTSSDILRWLDPASETLEGVGEAARAIAELDDSDMEKLCAAAEYIRPGSASALRELAERLDLFEFCPGVSTPEEYGRYLIAGSGFCKHDAELSDFFDLEGYGKWRLENERGTFLESGYICYKGEAPWETLFLESERPAGPDMKMGGM